MTADQDRPGDQSEGQGLLEFRDLLRGVGREDGAGPQLGHQVVVAGVEPLGHLQRRDVPRAAGHREEAVQGVGVHGGPVAFGDRTDHHGRVEDVVVEGEVAGGDFGDPGGGQFLPVGAAQAGGGGPEGVGGDAALPVALDGLLELAVLAPARVAVHGGPCRRGCVLVVTEISFERRIPGGPEDLYARRSDTDGGALAPGWRGRPPDVYADPPTRSLGCPCASYAHGQVAGLRTREHVHPTGRTPSGRRFPDPLPGPSAYDGGRSHSPLRQSRNSTGFPLCDALSG